MSDKKEIGFNPFVAAQRVASQTNNAQSVATKPNGGASSKEGSGTKPEVKKESGIAKTGGTASSIPQFGPTGVSAKPIGTG